MISSNDFRPGVTIEYNGDPCQVLEFQHVKPGKGAAFVRTKLKNLKTGATTELTFGSTTEASTTSSETATQPENGDGSGEYPYYGGSMDDFFERYFGTSYSAAA